MITSCHYGYGMHEVDLTTANKAEALKYWYITQITYKSCINLTKASILFLYIRIFGNIRWFRYACMALLTVVCMYCVASVVVTIFQCTPVERTWDRTFNGTCIDTKTFWYANAGFSIATDLMILIIPLPLVWGLQLPIIQKLALMAVFLIGSL